MADAAEAGAVGWQDRWAARRAGLVRRRAPLARWPDAPLVGDPARGAALRDWAEDAGDPPPPWDTPPPPLAGAGELAGFLWLDDLAALGTASARRLALAWVADWLTKFGHGQGPGWTLPVAAARFARLVDHGEWLRMGQDGLPRSRLERAYARHQRFAEVRLRALPPGTAGLEVLRDLTRAVCALDEPGRMPARLATALSARAPLVEGGPTAGRAPEALAETFAALAEAARALDEAGAPPEAAHRAALQRLAPMVRGVRLGHGALARFHGGDGGVPARTDAALQALQPLGLGRGGAPELRPMGYVRLARGATAVLLDAAAPPPGPGAHASLLAFEMSVGRMPLVVNCGPGARFGEDWREAARGTPSHSTLALDGLSSAPLVPAGQPAEHGPATLEVETDADLDGAEAAVTAAHNGYAARFGVVHARKLHLALDGLTLSGQDLLTALAGAGGAERRRGVPFAVRFHLPPEIEAEPAGGSAVRLYLPGGGRWRFEAEGPCVLSLDPSVYLENTRGHPEACQQIVLSGEAGAVQTMIGWRFAREAAPRADLRPVPDEAGVPAASQE